MVDLNIELPDNFLNEEVRCDYLVSNQIKKLWAIELDILVKILEVCKKHNIKIFVSSGSMLGAVRHKGFIPWDDDIDLDIDRENYKKLCEIGPSEFKYPYFFQTEETDKGSRRGHIQVRRSDTTAIQNKKYKDNKHINQGIFVDIFPVDNIPDNKDEEDNFRQQLADLRKKYSLSNLSFSDYTKSTSIIKSVIKAINYPLIKIKDKKNNYYNQAEQLVQKYNNIDCKYVGELSFNPLDKRYAYKKEWLDELIMVDFEFIKVPILKNYDESLKYTYGDYMKYEKGSACHSDLIIDTDKSYREYIK